MIILRAVAYTFLALCVGFALVILAFPLVSRDHGFPPRDEMPKVYRTMPTITHHCIRCHAGRK
jgi:hypothetical protein